MTKPETAPAFARHLSTIRRARLDVDRVMLSLEETRQLQEKTRGVVQEMLFDHVCLCQQQLPKMEDLGEASAIVARIIQSVERMQDLSAKLQESKPADLKLGLPTETRDALERELNAM